MISCSFRPNQDGLQTLPRLTARERESVIDAIDTGELVAVVDSQPLEGTAIVAVAVPAMADEITSGADQGATDRLFNRLNETRDELETLREIVREVMAEKVPADFAYRIHDCIADAEDKLGFAFNAAEDLLNDPKSLRICD